MKEFSWRGFFVGLLGLVITTASSMYVALRLGALPWPTVFVTILAMTILSKCKNSSLQEINVSHTMMSSGSMVAGGLAFTLPGLWMLFPDYEISLITVLIITVCGSILGTLFSWIFRKNLIEERNLVFPIGNAAYQTLINGLQKGRQSLKLFLSMGFSVIFTVIRDTFGLIPAVLNISQSVTMWISPMAMSIGAMIDSGSVLLWGLGAVLGTFVLKTEAVRQSLGIGIMLGTGAGILLKAFIENFKAKKTSGKIRKNNIFVLAPVVVLVSIILSLFTEIRLQEALLCCIGICLVSLLSGLLTGQSGINPMEVFGIIISLAVASLFKSSKPVMILLASVTAVSCGLSGDVMNDFRSGHLLGTNPGSQLIAEGIGGVLGAVVASFAIFVMKKSFGNFGTEILPAPQAKAVASMIGGFGDSKAMFIGLVIGCAVTLTGLSAATLGLGIYLSVQISSTVCLGALIAHVSKRLKIKNDDIILVSSGLLGGEGITGMVSAIVAMF